MPRKVKMISMAQMTRELERLKDHKVRDRYTIADMAYLTGWTQNYLRILERQRRIPRSERRESPPFTRHWTEEGARAILGFHAAQEKKHHNGGS